MDIDAQATKCLYGTLDLVIESLTDGSKREVMKSNRFIQAVALSQDGNLAAAGDIGGSVSIVNVANEELTSFKYDDHGMPVRDIKFSPTSAQVMSCSDDMHINFSDVETQK